MSLNGGDSDRPLKKSPWRDAEGFFIMGNLQLVIGNGLFSPFAP
jgi:hypothetical protein